MKKRIILTTLVLLIAVAGFFAWKFLGAAVKVKDMDKPFLYIKTGATHEDVKKELLAGGFLKTTRWYDMVSSLMKYKTVNPGRYKLRQGLSLMDLVKMLRSGNQTLVNFSITKIRTKETLASRIGKMFETDSLQMITFLNSPDSLKKYDIDTNSVMIVPLPLTYPMKWNSTASGIFEHFYTAYKKFWTDERKSQALNKGLTPAQASIVASIVDEETNASKEKGTIASVYLNRIEAGMPLQADPTLKFAVKDFGLKRIGGDIMKTPSPYNTYINKGLPPGPICTPQLETIDSVLTTPKTDYYYFVASTNFDGTHMFTTNLTDHGKLARQYHKELNKRKILLKSKKDAGD